MRAFDARPTVPGLAKAWDLLAAAPLIAWTAYSLYRQVPALARFAGGHAHTAPMVFYAAAAAKLASILFLALLLVLLIRRRTPVGKSKGWFPRLAAIAGTYVGVAVMLLPPRDLGWCVALVSALLVLAGTFVALFALIRLGRSISLMPEARGLVTTGPYRLIRHPLYLGEALMLAGISLQFLSWRALLIVGLQFAFQLQRMAYEERVLTCSFPGYGAYCARTARLIPFLY